MTQSLLSSLSVVGLLLGAMTLIAAIEMVIPLRPRGPWNKQHLSPNLVMTLITFGTNILLTMPLVAVAVRLQARGLGLLPLLARPSLATVLLGVVVLDFAAYLAHVTMHQVPALWRFHRVHHSDPTVDVTTALRQHPGETLIRYGFLAVSALGLGVDPGALAFYRALSAINSLLEHANIRVPQRIDRLLALVIVSPTMHKVHHSRLEPFTNTNYGNILAVFDRLFLTFTPAKHGRDVAYGLDGFDDPATQTTAGLLVVP